MKPVNQQLIKNTNLKRLYNSVFSQQGVSRADLARRTGLSRTAVSDLIDDLSQRGFLYDSGTGASPGVGRNPNCLQLCRGNYYVLVFEWEKTAVWVHLVDISGSCPLHRKICRKPEDSYIELCRAFLDGRLPGAEAGESAGEDAAFVCGSSSGSAPARASSPASGRDLDGVSFPLPCEGCPGHLLGLCFVLPAMIEPEREEVFSTTFSLEQDGGGTGVIAALRSRFPEYTVAVLNDTACAAYAEKIYTHITEKDFAFIRFSQGIGAALFVGDRPLGGACASHVQFGHVSISPLGPPCPCGNRGCLELMLSEDTLPGRLHREGSFSYQELGEAALCKDADAERVIRDLGREFSIALSNLICLTRPSLIVLGGNVRHLGELFLEEIRRSLSESSFRKMTENLVLRYSLLDQGACCYGAMKYFFDYHFQFIPDGENTFFVG